MAQKTDKQTRDANAGTPEQVKRSFACRVTTVPGKDRVLRFIASTEEVARDGDIVKVAGWETDRFMENPVFLWSHNHDLPPIGRGVRVKKVAKPKDGGGPRLEIDVEFAGLEQLHEDAERIYLLYRDGFLRAVSVGFRPLEYQDLTEEQKKQLGLGAWGRVIKRAELWELSACTIPADTGALLIEDEEDRAAVKGHLLAVRAIAPEADRAGFDALAESLDVEPPAPDPGPDPVLTELRALRTLVEERLPIPAQRAPESPATPAPADGTASDPAAPSPPPTGTPPPTSRMAPDGDFYGVLDALLERKHETKE